MILSKKIMVFTSILLVLSTEIALAAPSSKLQYATSAETGQNSLGADYSTNQPALPNVGANFSSSGPYANYILIATVPANSARTNIEIDNNSGSQIAVIRDDGTAGTGSAPVNASVFPLAGGAGTGSQGGGWSSQTFQGRLQIYAPVSTAQVAVMED
ncbi:hypothetical protein [Telmatospirillum siberiense]|uniref:hypothetical protein n=1 Tax=Telmatospirillum siberiense TaxID=382514 RepID=UPI0011AFC830|nr:hypothetical protein [Telmatospirillum siberiense]